MDEKYSYGESDVQGVKQTMVKSLKATKTNVFYEGKNLKGCITSKEYHFKGDRSRNI